MSGRRIEALFIDFYGTISADDHEAVDRACRDVIATLDLPLTSQEFAVRWGKVFFRTIETANHDRFRTLHECECDSLVRTLAEFGIHGVDPEPFVAVLKNYWQKPPLHADAVDFLARVDIPVCCVSNADREDIESAVAMHGLRFDAFITSQCARSYKPDETIFRRALDLMGVPAERVMHVGDSLHSDVGGARKLGIATAWVCRNRRIFDIGQCPADHTIPTLSDLPRLLTSRGSSA